MPRPQRESWWHWWPIKLLTILLCCLCIPVAIVLAILIGILLLFYVGTRAIARWLDYERPKKSFFTQNRNLCWRCRRITVQRLRGGFTHHKSYDSLELSANTCSLCDLFVKSLSSDEGSRKGRVLIQENNENGMKEKRKWKPKLFAEHAICRVGDAQGKIRLSAEFGNETDLILENQPLRYHAASPENLELIHHGVEECDEKHLGCNVKAHQKNLPLPTRVIDLGVPSCSEDLRLLVSKGQTGRWIALSHCWGLAPFITTTTKNIDRHKDGIKLDDLPRTFQDAVALCMHFSIRYLWIDSLCILQDSHEDWKREASRMPSIFANSYLTIVASASDNAHGGMLLPRKSLLRSVRFELPNSFIYFQIIGPEGTDIPEGGYTERRAWCLQERILSKRVLSFSPSKISWTCDVYSVNEASYRDRRKPYQSFECRSWALLSVLPKKTAEHSASSPNDGRPKKDLVENWNRTLTDYSPRLLTYPGDKLAAISGLSRRVGESLNHEYLAGIWKRLLPDALVWHRHLPDPYIGQPIARKIYPPVAEYRAPSWSWASVDGPLDFSDCEFDYTEWYCSVLSSPEIPSNVDPYNHVLRGGITLSAPVKRCIVGPKPPVEKAIKAECYMLPELWKADDQPIEEDVYCVFDGEELEAGQEVWCAQIKWEVGLILSLVSTEGPAGDGCKQMRFKRLGVSKCAARDFGGESYVEDWFDREDRKEITLI